MEVCPVGFFCFDKNTIILTIVALIILVSSYIGKNNDKFNQISRNIKQYQAQLSDNLTNLKQKNNILEYDLKKENEKLKSKLEINNNIINSKLETNNQIADEARYLANKDINRVIHPLVPPERSYPYKINQVGIPVNVPTRGYSTGYQQVGVLIEEGDKDSKLLPLYGEQSWPGSRQWKYYTSSDGFQSVKLPVISNNRDCQDTYGCDEIYNDSHVSVQGYKGRKFKANIYKLDGPKYIPFII